MEKELFALLRLGLGNSKAEEGNLSDFILLSAAQWSRIGYFAQEQGVLGAMLDGIDRLDATGYGATKALSKEQKLEWIGNVLNGYEVRNQHQLEVISDLQNRWAEAGLRMMVMKGQAMGIYYPNPKHRAPGDIDCYLFGGYIKGNETARTWTAEVDEGWYKHSVISFRDETIENHQYFVHTREGKTSKRLNQELVNLLNDEKFDYLPGTGALLPPPMFNALFLIYHALAHFLEEGLRLKQVLDWAMFLKHNAGKVNWQEYYRLCEQFHFRRFSDVMNDIAVHYLGVRIDNNDITISSPYTGKVLHSVLYDKDFVFGSGQSKWSNRWHIVTNLYKYRWKYKKIYQHSILRQLWYYAIGFVFKTE